MFSSPRNKLKTTSANIHNEYKKRKILTVIMNSQI